MELVVRRTRHLVNGVEQLLAMTDMPSVEELSVQASHWANDYGSYSPIMLDDDETSMRFYHGWHWAWLDFPFTLAAFWGAVEVAHRVVERHDQIRELPEVGDGYTEAEVTAELATLFGVTIPHLVRAIGGGWYACDVGLLGEWLDGEEEIARWYGSGTPVQVYLGLATTTAVVAIPDPARAGRTKDELTWHARVPLGTRSQLTELSEAVRSACEERHHDLWTCPGCRSHIAPERRRRVCDTCRSTYM